MASITATQTPCICEFNHNDQDLKKELEQVNQLQPEELGSRLESFSPENIAALRAEYINLDQAHKDMLVERLTKLPIPAITKDFFLMQIVQKSSEPLTDWQKV